MSSRRSVQDVILTFARRVVTIPEMYWIEPVGSRVSPTGLSPLAARIWLSGFLLVGFFSLPSVAVSCLPETDQAPPGVSAVHYHPSINWQESSVIFGDFGCRGSPQAALIGVTPEAMHVAIFTAGLHRPPVLMPFSNPRRSPTSSQLQVITMERLARTARVATGGLPAGMRPKAPCDAIRLDDGKVDAVYIFWNYKAKRFDSWHN